MPPAGPGRPPRAAGARRVLALGLVLVGLAAAAPACAPLDRVGQRWWEGRRDPSGQAPDPATTPEAVVQVYGARAVGWRGLLAVHTWIVLKPRDAAAYTRYEVMGWGVANGRPAIRINRAGPDDHWFGARPERLLDRRGSEAEALIGPIEAAVRSYPYAETYRTWPGPNSNTFIAYIGRAVPALGLDLPPTAIGKDFLANGDLLARSPGGRGVQLSLWGLLGVLAGWEEGLEVNLLGLSVGVDVKEPALRLPVVGRVGTP
jgi:hypothetical protein